MSFLWESNAFLKSKRRRRPIWFVSIGRDKPSAGSWWFPFSREKKSIESQVRRGGMVRKGKAKSFYLSILNNFYHKRHWCLGLSTVRGRQSFRWTKWTWYTYNRNRKLKQKKKVGDFLLPPNKHRQNRNRKFLRNKMSLRLSRRKGAEGISCIQENHWSSCTLYTVRETTAY